MPIKHRPLEERFRENIDIRGVDECWLWVGCHNRYGYGRIAEGWRGGRDFMAHRVAWELAHPDESIGEGEVICHSCDNPPCCNPKHLWKGTIADNNNDKVIKGRGRARKSKSLEERLWEHVDKHGKNDCWEWTRCRNNAGYGTIKKGGHAGASLLVHRVSWDLAHPDSLVKKDEVICHGCDNPPCVNPNHLWRGTVADKNRNMMIKGRGRGAKLFGSSNHSSKLKDADIPIIRKLREQGYTHLAIADTFGVSGSTISDILNGHRWRNA